MPNKNFMSYDNAEEVLGAFADEINDKTPVTRMTVGSSDGHVIQFETDRAYGDVLVSISASVSGIKELYLLSSMGDGGYSRTKVTRLAKGINGNTDSRIKFYVSSTSGVYTIWADATYSSIANERLFVSVVQLGDKAYTLSKIAALPADAIAARFADNANPAFTGTLAEWNALQDYEKAAYDLVNITDDQETGDTTDAITDGDLRAATSNAVFDYIKSLFYATPFSSGIDLNTCLPTNGLLPKMWSTDATATVVTLLNKPTDGVYGGEVLLVALPMNSGTGVSYTEQLYFSSSANSHALHIRHGRRDGSNWVWSAWKQIAFT